MINVTDLASQINNKNKRENMIHSQIKQLETKEKEYINKLDMLYEDKFKSLVSEETYKRIANETESLLNKIRGQINTLKNDGKILKNKTSELKEYEEKIKMLIDIDNPTREFLQTIIEKIIIDKDKNIEIIYKFSILNNL